MKWGYTTLGDSDRRIAEIEKTVVEGVVESECDSIEFNKPEKTEAQLRADILVAAIDNAKKIYEVNQRHEEKKSKWRAFFIIAISIILFASLIFIGISLWKGKLSDVAISACFVNVFVNVFAILFFMIKYVHNDLYLETFKTTTQKLLDYLIQDKNGNA